MTRIHSFVGKRRAWFHSSVQHVTTRTPQKGILSSKDAPGGTSLGVFIFLARRSTFSTTLWHGTTLHQSRIGMRSFSNSIMEGLEALFTRAQRPSSRRRSPTGRAVT